MTKNNIFAVILILLVGTTHLFAGNKCELSNNEQLLLEKIVSKIDQGMYDEELFDLIPSNYGVFQKFFAYLWPLELDTEIIPHKFAENTNALFINVDVRCFANLEDYSYIKFNDLFAKMKKIDEKKFTEKYIRIFAGPWTADNFLVIDGVLYDSVFNSQNEYTLHVLQEIDFQVIQGLVARYNTTPQRAKECGDYLCPIVIPDYALKMPEDIQKRFEKAREALLK